jgi:hypothetical protein
MPTDPDPVGLNPVGLFENQMKVSKIELARFSSRDILTYWHLSK